MTKKELRMCPSMNIQFFLQTYYGTSENIAKKLAVHSHKALNKIALDYGVRLSKICFDNVTREMIATGQIILVEDRFKKVAPYINPMVLIEDEFYTTMDERYVSYEVYDFREDDEYDKHKRRQKTKHIKP